MKLLLFILLGCFVSSTEAQQNDSTEHFYYSKVSRLYKDNSDEKAGESYVYFTKDFCIFKLGGIKQLKAFKVQNYKEEYINYPNGKYFTFMCDPKSGSSFLFYIRPGTDDKADVSVKMGDYSCGFEGSQNLSKMGEIKKLIKNSNTN